MKVAVGYIRKSRVLDEKRGVSWEVQESKVRELAALNGDTDPLILSDWNISGRKGVEGRPGYRTLIAMIEEDRVSAIYAYNLARLGRSVHGLRALVSLADAHDVPVRLVTDRIDTSTATGRMLFTILAAVDEMTADIASEHSRATVVARQAAGHRIGPPFYGENCPPDCAIVHARGHHIVGEDPDAVVAAFEEAGSVMGACRLLNTRGVPTRMGGPWSTVTVRELLVRLKAMPHRPRPGAKAKAPFVLYGLLRCGQCAHTLTGTRYRNGSDLAYVSYKCHRARGAVDHGPGSVPEKRILPWIRAEAARLRVPPEVEQTVRDNTAETAALAERRRRLLAAFADGMDEATYRTRLAAIDLELGKVEASTRLLTVPPSIPWGASAATVNAILRTIWDHVELDAEMRPVCAEWRLPAEYVGPAE